MHKALAAAGVSTLCNLRAVEPSSVLLAVSSQITQVQ